MTGSNGLLGSWLCRELLRRGAFVVGLSGSGRVAHPSFQLGGTRWLLETCPLSSFERLVQSLSIHAVDTVFHLAALSTLEAGATDPRLAFETNIQGSWNLLEACRQAGNIDRIVLASSTRAYGSGSTDQCSETDPDHPASPYAVSKACADLIGQAYWRNYGLPIVIARFGNFFGGGDLNFTRIVPGTIRSIIMKEAPVIQSDGGAVLEYSYVLDMTQACLKLAENVNDPRVSGEIFNISSGYRLSVLELSEHIIKAADATGIKPRIMGLCPSGGDSPKIVTDKARSLLNWQPIYPLEQALTETIEWYRTNPGLLAIEQ